MESVMDERQMEYGEWGRGKGEWAGQMKMRMRMVMAMSLDSGRVGRVLATCHMGARK